MKNKLISAGKKLHSVRVHVAFVLLVTIFSASMFNAVMAVDYDVQLNQQSALQPTPQNAPGSWPQDLKPQFNGLAIGTTVQNGTQTNNAFIDSYGNISTKGGIKSDSNSGITAQNKNAADDSVGVAGKTTTSEKGIGVLGESDKGVGVKGVSSNDFTNNQFNKGVGVSGESLNGIGVYGKGSIYGIYAEGTTNNGAFIKGKINGIITQGGVNGVYSVITKENGIGVSGKAMSLNGGKGVYGYADAINGIGVYAENKNTGGTALVAKGIFQLLKTFKDTQDKDVTYTSQFKFDDANAGILEIMATTSIKTISFLIANAGLQVMDQFKVSKINDDKTETHLLTVNEADGVTVKGGIHGAKNNEGNFTAAVFDQGISSTSNKPNIFDGLLWMRAEFGVKDGNKVTLKGTKVDLTDAKVDFTGATVTGLDTSMSSKIEIQTQNVTNKIIKTSTSTSATVSCKKPEEKLISCSGLAKAENDATKFFPIAGTLINPNKNECLIVSTDPNVTHFAMTLTCAK